MLSWQFFGVLYVANISSSAVDGAVGLNISPIEAVNGGNAAFIEDLYRIYRQNPNQVDAQWRAFFAGFDLSGDSHTPAAPVAAYLGQSTLDSIGRNEVAARQVPAGATSGEWNGELRINDLIHAYRELGHLVANLDPLGHNISQHPLLDLTEFDLSPADLNKPVNCAAFGGIPGAHCTLRELLHALRETYCGTFAVEFMEIRDPEQREWLIAQMEVVRNKPVIDAAQQQKIMSRLIAAEDFEQFLQRRFPTVKRFSNEGGDSLITLLDEIVNTGAVLGVDEILFGMAHRGRLNVLAHTLHKPYEMILSEVIGRPAVKTVGDGDVKYHLGYAYDYMAPTGQLVHLALAANPSHLEIVNPVVEGMCRAKQNRKGDMDRHRTVPVLIHGDAAFTGQGIVAETLYLSELEAYRTGGTLHLIINNQIGFTTNPSDGRFTRYPSDVAKAIQAPVFHVNADDPEAVLHAARLAIQFRQRFKADVIVDLVCYRRRGHNELDDASVTQPVMAREIAAHPTVREIYAKRLITAGVVSQEQIDKMAADLREKLEKALEYAQTFKPSDSPPPVHGPWANFARIPKDWSVNTAVDKPTLKKLVRDICAVPEGFHIHPTVQRMMEQRIESVDSEKEINWGCGEMLGLGTLIHEGTWIRLTGQDVGRGTFSHRNAVWFDNRTGRPFVPLANYAEQLNHAKVLAGGTESLVTGGGRFMIINTMLAELSVVGFEYGFASADPEALVIWEAQFGDFVNMAQPIIDQFIASAESKWGKYNGLVMLLPHGYEGQGPEHSHGRLERFLQLCAEDNMTVCVPTTPAQIFHLLRRQVKRTFRKPLIVMSPKSMLRNKLAVSTLDEFATGSYLELIDETDAAIEKSKVRRVLMCSGKIYYELLAERTKQRLTDVAIIRLEQIYPFPAERLTAISRQYPRDVEIIWVQEEPRNNGVYPFIGAKLHYYWTSMKKLYYVGRKPSASPAAGSYEQHNKEQADILARALGVADLPAAMREGKLMDTHMVETKGSVKSSNVEVKTVP